MKLFILTSLLLVPLLAAAQKKPGEAATIQEVEILGELKPGATVIAVIKVKLDAGYHTHSNQPSEPQFIPTVLKMDSVAGVEIGKFIYPPGKSEKVTGLPKPISIYDKAFEIKVPLKLKADVTLPIVIPGNLNYQACQGAVCYPPKKLKVEIKVPAKS